MPDEGMTSHDHTVLLSEGYHSIGIGEAKAVPARLDSIPFHRILRSELAKLCADDVEIWGIAEMIRV